MVGTGFKDYYSVLGVNKSATADEIKKAFRQLARKYHPDVNPGNKVAEDRFKEINEAYEVLSDPDKRKKYDQFGQYWNKVGTGTPGGYSSNVDFDDFEFGRFSNFEDFINDLLGRMGGGSPGAGSYGRSADPFGGFRQPSGGYGSYGGTQTPSQNLDTEAKISLSFHDAFHGVQKRLSVGQEIITVNIPAGAKAGSKIRVRGKGNFSPHYTSQRGDLYLIVELLPHPFFQLDGDTLNCEVNISPDEAALGAQIEVPTPDGNVTVNVPAGIRSGQSLRLRGKGWKDTKGQRGDQMVKIIIAAPKELSAIEREAYETLRANRSTDPRANLKGVKL